MGLSVAVTKDFGSFSLDVSWEVGDELAVLFGRSGAGKSLTLQIIAGLFRPDRGRIVLNRTTCFDSGGDTDVPPQKRSLGYVFQDLALFPHMTVRQNILFGGSGLERRQREYMSEDMLERFRLTGLEDRLPGRISGGQKQRVALARALMRRPQALLLDEPFSALDGPVRMEMRRLLKDAQRTFNIPVILITHDLAEACALADRMIVYSQGKVAQVGPPGEIVRRPAAFDIEDLLRSEGVGMSNVSGHSTEFCACR